MDTNAMAEFQRRALGTLEKIHPSRLQIVRMTPELPPSLNIFHSDGVVMRGAMLYGETFNKAPIAFKLVKDGIEVGEIREDTIVICASSGQTGLGVALLCKLLGLKCVIIMGNDVPSPKVNAIAALGFPIDVELVSTEDTVARARRLGRSPGHYDTDQYARRANVQAQRDYMAPQLFKAHGGRIDLVFAAGGTLGTSTGICRYAEKHRCKTKVIPGICADGEEVPGARTQASIERDVTIASLKDFSDCMKIGRYTAFLSSYALFPVVPWTPPGPTSGLAFASALKFLLKHKIAGTLDQFRGSDDKIYVVFMCPDGSEKYLDLYKGELHKTRDFASPLIPGERLLELVR